jgi:drug/metabolite transporter (DMT)-like permease
MLLAGIFFGLSYVIMKHVFTIADFINGLFWTRLGLVGSALAILVYPPARRQIFDSFNHAAPSSKFLFALNKVLAAAAFIVLYYAIKIGSVVFVNALQGLQYVFILLIGFFVAKRMPLLFEWHLHEKIARKIIATILIFAGFFLLVF